MQNKKIAQIIYDRIIEKIISLEFPPGTKLQERALAEWLVVSRTPVREAVQRLAGEGWIEIIARRHLRVRPVREEDIREVFQLRSLIEPLALEQVFLQGKNRELACHMNAALEEMERLSDDRFHFIRTDQSFHALMIHAVGNARLNRFWEVTLREIIRLGMMAMQSRNRFEDVIEEHRRLAFSIGEGRHGDALFSLQEHLDITRRNVISNLVPDMEP